MITGQLAFFTIGKRIVDAVRDRLDEGDRGVTRAGMVPGAIAWDTAASEDCNQLAVSNMRVFLSDTLFQEAAGTLACDEAFRVAEFVVQVVRCAPQPGDRRLAPDMDALEGSAAVVEADSYDVLQGVNCLLADMEDDGEIVDFRLAPVVTVGPEGAVVGVEMHAMVALGRA